MKRFLCIVYERITDKQLAEYDDIQAEDWYYARHKAAYRFQDTSVARAKDWYVDSLEIDENGQPVKDYA